MEGTGVAPFEALTSFPPLIPLDIYLTPTKDFSFDNDKHQYKLEHPKRIKHVHNLMNKVKEEQRESRVARYNEEHRNVQFVVGDLVLAYKPAAVKGPRKLAINFRGPFEVTKVLGKGAYRIRLFRASPTTEWTVNVKNMVKYTLRQKPTPSEWPEVDGELPAPSRPPAVPLPAASSRSPAPSFSFDNLSEDEKGLLELRNLLNANVFMAPSGNRGVGVFSRRLLAAQTTLVEYTGLATSEAELHLRYPAEAVSRGADRFSMEVAPGHFVDAADFRLSSWARYVNAPGPSETANCEFVRLQKRVYLRTLVDIYEGEELLVDYGPQYVWVGPKLDGGGPRKPPPLVDLRDLLPALQAPLEELALGIDSEVGLPELPAHAGVPAPSPVEHKEEPPSPLAIIPEEFREGDFALLCLDVEPSPLYVGRLTSVDELREFANFHLYGTYTPGKVTARFAPAHTDPRDSRGVYTRTPKPRYHAQLVQAYPEHVKSGPFTLLHRGLLPPAILEQLEWG